MTTKIITVSAVPPAESSGADTNKGTALNATEFDQNIVNLRAAVDRALAALGGYTASQTPGANQIPVVRADSSTVLPGALTALAGNFTGEILVRSGAVAVKSIANTSTTNTLIRGVGYNTGGTDYGTVSVRSTYNNANNAASMEFYVGSSGTNTAEAMRISSSGNLLAGLTTDSGARIQSNVAAIGDKSLSLSRTGSSRFDFIQGVAGVTGDALQLRDATLSRDYLTLRDGKVLAGTTTANTSGASLQTKDGITFPATQVASSDPNTLDDYRVASFTATATGMTTSPTGTVSFARAGNLVIMTLPEISATSNATTFTLTGMPTTCRPSANRYVTVRVADNGGALAVGNAKIDSSGVITIYKDMAGSGFTAAGGKILGNLTISYII